jgi:uncharacterized membrane protein
MIVSSISNKNIKPSEAIKASDIRESLLSFIQKNHPEFSNEGYISYEELNFFRRLYITELVIQEKGELAKIDEDVVEAIRSNAVLTENIEEKIDEELTLGQRMADLIATFGGSWTFIISFFLFLFSWIILNAFVLGNHQYDPYPFILLNLILSCLAAIQAPIIMMSQNRQEQKDRERAEHDYKINLKAELEIKLLSEKVDHLIVQQNKKLLEIQELQLDYLNDVLNKLSKHE